MKQNQQPIDSNGIDTYNGNMSKDVAVMQNKNVLGNGYL
jgi:hypothetical protein